MLDCVKYSCDILPASYDSHIFRRIFKIDLPIIYKLNTMIALTQRGSLYERDKEKES